VIHAAAGDGGDGGDGVGDGGRGEAEGRGGWSRRLGWKGGEVVPGGAGGWGVGALVAAGGAK
jgi:hypothetical protein